MPVNMEDLWDRGTYVPETCPLDGDEHDKYNFITFEPL